MYLTKITHPWKFQLKRTFLSGKSFLRGGGPLKRLRYIQKSGLWHSKKDNRTIDYVPRFFALSFSVRIHLPKVDISNLRNRPQVAICDHSWNSVKRLLKYISLSIRSRSCRFFLLKHSVVNFLFDTHYHNSICIEKGNTPLRWFYDRSWSYDFHI